MLLPPGVGFVPVLWLHTKPGGHSEGSRTASVDTDLYRDVDLEVELQDAHESTQR